MWPLSNDGVLQDEIPSSSDEKPKEVPPSASSPDTIAMRHDIHIVADTLGAESSRQSGPRPDLSTFVFSTETMQDTTNAPPPISQEDILITETAKGIIFRGDIS